MPSPTATQDSSDVLFSFRPQATFSKTFSTLLAVLLLAIVVFSIVGFTRDGNLSLLLLSIGSGVALVGLLYLLTRLVDKAQASARLEVRSDGILIFRNAVGRVRTIGLKGARSVQARNLKGTPNRVPDLSRTRTRLSRPPTLGPKLTQIRIKDHNGKKLSFVLSGEMPRQELDRFYEVTDAFMALKH